MALYLGVRQYHVIGDYGARFSFLSRGGDSGLNSPGGRKKTKGTGSRRGSVASSCGPERTDSPAPLKSVRFTADVEFLDNVRQGDVEQVEAFVKGGELSLDTINTSGMAALHEASLRGHVEVVEALLRGGARIELRTEGGVTALHLACSQGHTAVIRHLLRKGASPVALSEGGDLPEDLLPHGRSDIRQMLRAARRGVLPDE